MPLHGVGGLERSVHDLVRHLAARDVDVTLIVPPAAFAARRQRRSVRLAAHPAPARAVSHLPVREPARHHDPRSQHGVPALRLARRPARRARSSRAAQVDIVHGFGASVLGYARPAARRRRSCSTRRASRSSAPRGDGLPSVKRVGYAPLRWAVRRVRPRAPTAIIATDASLEPTVARHLRPRRGPDADDSRTASISSQVSGAGRTGRRRADPAAARHRRRRDRAAQRRPARAQQGLRRARGGARRRRRGRPARCRPAAGAGSSSAPVRSAAILERAVATHGLGSHVVFAGRALDADLHAWYEAASVFVHPTRYEGSSLVTLEAMAHRGR